MSRATTITPASRALSIAGTIARERAGTIMMPFAPSSVMSASAATWLALSTSLLPAAVSRSTSFSPALSSAVFLIVTKKGFFSCLVMRPRVISSSPPPHATTPER